MSNSTKTTKLKSSKINKDMSIDDYRKKFDFHSNRLIHNSKRSGQPYKILKPYHKTQKIGNNNYGILTGEETGIIGVDLDTYKPEWNNEKEHSFITTFGKDYIKKFDTLTQSTPSGGIHLIFEYDEDVRQTQVNHCEIDIRNKGGYLVGAGSIVGGKLYRVKHFATIKPLPDDLKKYLMDNLYTTEEKETAKKIKNKKNVNKDFTECEYSFAYTTEEIEEKIVKELPIKYFTEYTFWIKFITAMKIMGQYDLANKYRMKHRVGSSKWNDKNFFNTAYNSIKKQNEFPMVEHILKVTNQLHILPYIKYKSLPDQIETPTDIINVEKLGYGLELSDNKNYVIKSDTGTGKTTIFKNSIGNKKFISIVSRISLADEQYRVFNESGVDCCHYKIEDFLENGESVIITIDSIMRINHFDFSNYVIFMDEFNSICEYILQADTCLGDKRAFIVKVLANMLINSKQIIAVDADISDLCFKIFKKLNIDYDYIINNYKHNKGVTSNEILSIETMIKQINIDRSVDIAVMVCCDSKTVAEYLYEQTGKTACLITNETTETPTFDNEPFIIFSPKVIYGIDGNWKTGRNVYCAFRESTISPANMVQQLSRERNINNLYYYFGKKKFTKCKYNNINECRIDMVKKHEYALTQFNIFEGSYNDLFFDMLVEYEYKQDCYNTNKFLHFLLILKNRGIEFLTQEKVSSKLNNEKIKEIAEKLRLENFDINSDHIININEYLKMNTAEYIEENKQLFINPNLLCNHFTNCEYFLKNNDMENKNDILFQTLSDIKEFPIKKLETNKYKILNVEMLKSISGYTETIKDNKTYFDCSIPLTPENNIKFNESYKLVFGGRCKDLDLTKINNIPKMLSKMISNICGDSIINSEKVREGKKTTNKLYINNDKLEYHKKLYNLRLTKNSLIQNYAGIHISVGNCDDDGCCEWNCE